MSTLESLLNGEGAKLQHDVSISFGDQMLVRIALVLIGVVVLNAVLRKVFK